jgi:hypothetical protein
MYATALKPFGRRNIATNFPIRTPDICSVTFKPSRCSRCDGDDDAANLSPNDNSPQAACFRRPSSRTRKGSRPGCSSLDALGSWRNSQTNLAVVDGLCYCVVHDQDGDVTQVVLESAYSIPIYGCAAQPEFSPGAITNTCAQVVLPSNGFADVADW